MKRFIDFRNLFNLFNESTIGKVFSRKTHEMEVDEHDRRLEVRARQKLISDSDLKSELMHKYGISKWSSKLVKEILAKRTALREKLFS